VSGDSFNFDLDQGERDFAYGFLVSFAAQYIYSDARPNWNPKAPLILGSHDPLVDLSTR
jgi:hypothetical protein